MIQKNYVYFFIFLMLLFSCAHKTDKNTSSLSDSPLSLNVQKFTLPNGLRLIISENKQLPIFSYYTYFDVGGRFESRENGTTGATHFLEHMMFKGAKKYGPGDFERIIEGNGGRSNAYTTFDSTVYYENLPSEMLC